MLVVKVKIPITTKHKQSEAILGMRTELELLWKNGGYLAPDFKGQKRGENSCFTMLISLNYGCV